MKEVSMDKETSKISRKGILTIKLTNPVRFPSYLKKQNFPGRKLTPSEDEEAAEEEAAEAEAEERAEAEAEAEAAEEAENQREEEAQEAAEAVEGDEEGDYENVEDLEPQGQPLSAEL